MLDEPFDLLVMAPHGGTGIRRILFGTLPERVVETALRPVLIARGGYLGVGDNPIGTIVIPDDGDPRHEQGWQTCVQVARAFRSRALLVAVVQETPDPRSGRGGASLLQPNASRNLWRLREEELARHLETHVADLRLAGVNADARVLRGEPPPHVVAEMALSERAGLVILRTHSRTGIVPRLAGGFAAQFLGMGASSVLVLPIEENSNRRRP
jgi:nucleotide-binding universal stress UspA family protein